MKNVLQVFCILSFAICGISAQASELIKKSSSGICHGPDSQYYDKVKHFQSYSSLNKCLASGGRLPKGQSSFAIEKVNPTQNKQKYSRDKFGKGWADFDHDCQNTRQEILISLSTAPVHFSDGRKCRVTSGRWISMYSGLIITNAGKVDIDHIVPLKWAWEHGADRWSLEKREMFANDPINLVAVEASLNREKGAKGPDEWLPPKNIQQYKARFERILKKYKLRVEH